MEKAPEKRPVKALLAEKCGMDEAKYMGLDLGVGVDRTAEAPIQTINPEERAARLNAIKESILADERAQQSAIARGLPYTNQHCYYLDEYDRMRRFWNPKTQKSIPKVSIPAFTSVHVIKTTKEGFVIVTVDKHNRAGKFKIPSDAITCPPPPVGEGGVLSKPVTAIV